MLVECENCNGILEYDEEKSAIGLLPEGVIGLSTAFYECPDCGRREEHYAMDTKVLFKGRLPMSTPDERAKMAEIIKERFFPTMAPGAYKLIKIRELVDLWKKREAAEPTSPGLQYCITWLEKILNSKGKIVLPEE